jgi:hypothetical protein
MESLDGGKYYTQMLKDLSNRQRQGEGERRFCIQL